MPTLSLRTAGILLALVLAVPVFGAPTNKEPHIGYLYPAGGRQGTSFQGTIGGQYLLGATNVFVSGEGVSVSVIRHIKPLNNQQQGAVRKHLEHLRRTRQALKAGKEPPKPPEDMPELPEHPWLAGLSGMDTEALSELKLKLFDPKKQPNDQIAEMVEVNVSIADDALTGDRELRLRTRTGLTNPLCFQVGALPEVSEQEPNDHQGAEVPLLSAPMLLNGQIKPGDIDRFQLRARKGQQLLVDARARRLIPYLADAVPGWFQAILTLYDAQGKEIAFADDYRFHPDPHLFVEIPADGDYALEIRDAIYRGREDFVYRLAITEADSASMEDVAEPAPLETANLEHEPNDTPAQAERIDLPRWIGGCIGQAGDIDYFSFAGRAGDEVVADVLARRELNSPVDAVIKLLDADGKTLAWNDDYMKKEGPLHLGPGLLTHHADAYFRTRLPKDGTYFLRLEEAQGHGGPAYTYRLRVSPPQPDFALCAVPSSLSIPAGRTVPVAIHVLRRDGFDGDIELSLADAPEGFALGGARIPAGRDHIRVTLTAPTQVRGAPVALRLEGKAKIGEQEIRHPAVPADDTMQAFLWRHLVPAQEFLVSVDARKRPAPPIRLVGPSPLQIAPGGTAEFKMEFPKWLKLKDLEWKLLEPLAGITLQQTRVEAGLLVFALQADAEHVKSGVQDNLIIEAFANWQPAGKDKKANKKSGRHSLGVLPAIPMETVAP